MSETPVVLFLCVHNAGRSQMAAALMEREAGDRIRVLSAGTEPADQVNPAVREAMREIDLDLSGRVPRLLENEEVRAADVVVTMGCGDACPYYPGTRYVDWQLEDPADKALDQVRPIRDDIERRVRGLVVEMLGRPAG